MDDLIDEHGVDGGIDEAAVDPECISWMRQRVTLTGFNPESDWKEENTAAISEFLITSTMKRLLIFMEPVVNQLAIQWTLPLEPVREILYFIRTDDKRAITPENIGDVVQYGTIEGSAVESLLRLMGNVYVPTFLSNETWPESIKKEFAGQLHKFMASCTETVYSMKGSTELYIPKEDITDPELVAREKKDLVQRLESALIHWTRQIKEVVSNQENSVRDENAGPLDEVEFWRSRCLDLSGIREQLDRPGIEQIVAVLEHAKSSYLLPFKKLSNLIQQGSMEAQDNLKFLSTLSQPCEELAEAEPKKIPKILPTILNCVRMIWGISRFYNTTERLSGLLRKVSNEIINRSCAKIDLEEIFEGDVDASIVVLQDSIAAGEAWKAAYRKTADQLAARGGTHTWDFDDSSIFAQIDAFVQRCRDLQEVCEGQIQFARKSAAVARGEKADLPAFGGSRGPEIRKSLLDIESAFEKHLNNLKGVKYSILDVKATKWHDDYGAFKRGMKDLEVMMQNVINSSFESVTSTQQGVELLEAFHHIAKRDSIKRCVDKKAADVFALFLRDIGEVKKDFDMNKRNPPLQPSHPKFAGQAWWSKSLQNRLKHQFNLLNSTIYLMNSREAEEAKTQYNAITQALEEYSRRAYSEWMQTLEANLSKGLENPLMIRNTRALLELNFDRDLLRLFNEVMYWERLHVEIPYTAMDVASLKEKLRVIRENVLLVIRDYNTIITTLSHEERRLFQERIQYLDRKINPGLTKLTWGSKGVVDYFVKEVRRHCRDAYKIVTDFKTAAEKIDKNCKCIADTLLVSIEKKRVYSEGEFEVTQQEYREGVREKLRRYHEEIKEIMQGTYEYFKHDTDKVLMEWMKYTEKIDKKIEESLRTTVRKSLQEISRAMNGDSKQEVQPLFKINVVLDKPQGQSSGQQRVEFRPTMNNLKDMVNHISQEMFMTLTVLPRLTEVLDVEEVEDDDEENADKEKKTESGEDGKAQGATAGAQQDSAAPEGEGDEEEKPAQKSFYEVMLHDDDILKILVTIMNGMQANIEKITAHVVIWDKYKHIWELDKGAFIRRYAKANKPLSTFDADVTKYRDLQNEIQNEETITNINFIRLDCAPLKSALVAHCNEWQKRFTQLLNTNAANELQSLHNLFETSMQKMKEQPSHLDALGVSMGHVQKLQAELPDIEARFEPLHRQYQTLDKFEVAYKPEESEQLNLLPMVWNKFRQAIEAAQEMLDKCKQKFKAELLHDLDSFNKKVAAMREDVVSKMPMEADIEPSKAHAFVSEFRAQVAEKKAVVEKMAHGLALFRIEQPQYREIVATNKDLDLVDAIWTLQDEWNRAWDGWKTGVFADLNVNEMETLAQSYHKRCGKLKEIKTWPVWISLRAKIDQFRRTMPLILDLKNPAMRSRHWDQLMDDIARRFDPLGPDFTLEKIFEFGLDNYADIIANLSQSASKELAIEDSLKGIAAQWEELELDIVPYKNQEHHKLRSTDDLFQALEDNLVTLSTMKASRYFLAFETEIETWENTLSHIAEVIEMILQVQRQWMYLESIFAGSEDIRKQLPSECGLFDNVNTSWKTAMDGLHADPNARRGAHTPNLLKDLNIMNNKLDQIQKSLDQYLETKRQSFPRFYFLSNDDLLEILGQSRDPLAVQPHLKKCFDNIKSLEFSQPGRDGRSVKHEAWGMYSSDGEYVPFQKVVIAEGPVELWLISVENAMRETLRTLLRNAMPAMKSSRPEKAIKDTTGMLLLTGGQIVWTADCTKALMDLENGKSKNSLKVLKKKQLAKLNRLTDMVRGQLTHLERLKIVAILTLEVHGRDVIEKMIKAGCNSTNDFEWLQQLRYYWDKVDEVEDCFVRCTNTEFRFNYEYLGNSGRLVVTPLTDRCYLTLTTALSLRRGGSPAGPAGTGKTETVKDLGKALGKYVIVFNCSDGLDYKAMGRTFSGLAQTGAWGCFDEFNRIEIEVLSVVAQQILSILTAISDNKPKFNFQGAEIRLNPQCGIFVTMNPGYAGRTELPDNLKSLFRPVAMMVPDSALIAEIMLFSEGFSTAKPLSKKITTLYQLANQQLSKQDHYDFGLRAIKSVLMNAGGLKRADSEMQEDLLLLRSLRDMNLPKFIHDDVPLFMALISDLFPGLEYPQVDYGAFSQAIEAELKADGLQLNAHMISKVIQLKETMATRHGNMLVGRAGSGKSTCWSVLQRAMTRLAKEGHEEYNQVRTLIINPKALSLGELYGEYELATREWTDGVLSHLMRDASADDKPDNKWIILDGPVDTLWIESMNSVLDDNKVLTLINGERIAMPDQVKLLFEVEDLAVASPATVSRCGMVYLDTTDLGWWPYVESWLQRRPDPDEADVLRKLFEKFVPKLLEFKNRECVMLIHVADLCAVTGLCNLYEALATPENGVNKDDTDFYSRMIELWFLFAAIWSIGAAVDEESRKKFDGYLRELEGQFPTKDTVYEYYVDPKKRTWVLWEEKVPNAWKPLPNTPFYKILVPTIDTVRNTFLVNSLTRKGKQTLLIGSTGTGKTQMIQALLPTLGEQFLGMTVNFSAQTTSQKLQDILEGRVEKRTKEIYTPPVGKKLVVFCDDLNMPAKDTFGSQPPLELLRQWMDYGFWYDRVKQTPKYIRDIQLLAAIGPPGGGRSKMSQRLQSRFNVITVTQPNDNSTKRIFGTLIHNKLAVFEEDIKSLGDTLCQGTIEVYRAVTKELLPTPSKSHYIFNLRDVGKVVEGILRSHRDFYDNKEAMIRLWVHECMRVYSDRLNTVEDKKWFEGLINDKLTTLFSTSWGRIARSGYAPIFGDFMREGMEPPVYEEIPDIKELKKFMEDQLEDYNLEGASVQMDLVMFRDALEHVCRIHRVLTLPRGNVLLVGVGGSGRQSLSRLASFIAGYKVFQIEISKHYRLQEFHEDLISLYKMAGVEQKPVTFLFSDTQIVNESFLEDISNMLSSGMVPNLFGPEDLQEIRDGVRADAKAQGRLETNDSLYQFFLERALKNLHIVLTMSPVGDAFRNRLRMFPAIVNCTTIDWFSEWPTEALKEVGRKFLDDLELGADGTKSAVAEVFVSAHDSVVQLSSRMKNELRRVNYVTPTNYLELVSGYRALLNEKRQEMTDNINKFRNGLIKLEETREQVEVMSVELEEKKEIVTKSQKECADLLVVIVQERRIADEQAKQVAADSDRIQREEGEVKIIADAARADLEEAMPALLLATKALESLNKKDLSEIKAFTRPPVLVERVMKAVMTLRKSDTSWANAKKELGDPNFLKQLIDYDKDNISDGLLKKIEKFTSDPDFSPDNVAKVSVACKSLCMWIIAMEKYARVYRVVKPKRDAVDSAMAALAEKQAALSKAKEELEVLTNKVLTLKNQYEESVSNKERLQKEMEETELKLGRAEKLVEGLSGERGRWEASAAEIEGQKGNLMGDCLVAAAFLSYAGPFNPAYRRELVEQMWLSQVRNLGIPCTPDFSFVNFMANPSDVREWNIQGLPSDTFSTENGVLVTRGRRWPLMIDPQQQANKWIKHLEGNALKVIDLKQSDYLRTLENAVQFGTPVLMQDIREELDPSLEPILNKSIIRQGSRMFIKLGDKEIEFNPDFRLYFTTKLSNPHYAPEISTKTTMVNFAVKEEGLEAQLLAFVVKKEKPDLEEQKNSLVVSMAAGKKKMVELEDEILRLLSTASGSLLDDEHLLVALQDSKSTSEEIKQQLIVSEQTEIKIDAAREAYRGAAFRASILFFALTDLASVDPMYQFSLDWYLSLYTNSIEKSPKTEDINDRTRLLNDYHTYNVYRATVRGLFEKHKLLFSFQLCVKILQGSNKINNEEYLFLLRGGVVLNREGQPKNPCSEWLPPESWDNITELDNLPNFRNIVASFEQNSLDWKAWYRTQHPEDATLPGEWEQKCNELQRMIIVRSLRPDRVLTTVTAFITTHLGQKFTEPPSVHLNEILGDSTNQTPLIFVLSPGVDPVAQLMQLAKDNDMVRKFKHISLGQGQAPVANRLLEEGVRDGNWVLLANCHLSISWMPSLEKWLEKLPGRKVHPNFRLWLSSDPHPKFPISILQISIKMTTEPPRGLRANMFRIYNTLVTEERFARCQAQSKYKKLVFTLCWFHSVLLERRKFLTLGWNIAYDFNDSDFDTSEKLIAQYLDFYEDTPWDALRYLIAEANYGGRVTDDWDRRLLREYSSSLFRDELLTTPNLPLSSLSAYFVPDDGPLQSYKDYINTLPGFDKPEAFGQHPNADIASQIHETSSVLQAILDLQPRTLSQGDGDQAVSTEDRVYALATDILNRLPDVIDEEEAAKMKADQMTPLSIVLIQEIIRYNVLLKTVKTQLEDLQKGIKGLVVMSHELDIAFDALLNGRVPPSWKDAYASLKPLAPWTRDLIARVKQLYDWAYGNQPKVFWLSGFTFPTAFLTALLQTASRKNNISIDALTWEFTVDNREESDIQAAPKEGALVKGLFLEGASWNHEHAHLDEPVPMELVCPLPMILFKPVEQRKKTSKGVYSCPCYYYPIRTGTRERPSFMLAIDLKSGEQEPDFWTRRGTAILMSQSS
eukprot:TRINITY_DN1232_c0_g1_i1.p1 TRINITY_DN1232_c0_g1~~TRINITY_DN1232_c0_g1_i1.p1  ORF type:complete len:4516 (+),score=1594.38 TRINITY_DN1232_c0_g1_i1:127-13674(+)